MDFQTEHEWQAEKYHLNSSVQQEAAIHLLKLLQLGGKERILDVGCGDGKITAAIASTLTEGQIVGSDVSQEMIQFASERFLPSTKNNLSFVLLDAQAINYVDLFDLVFSSFALQWVLDMELVIEKINISLRQNGRIGFTIPLSISDELEESLAFLIKDPQWAPYFDGFKLNYYLKDENYYDQLLPQYGFRKTHFEVVEQKWIFPSREDFEQYTLIWLPHLSALPEHLREKFFKQLMDKYVELTPTFEDGKLNFVFDRIDIIARKDFACQSI
ncbi:MAG: methyltransferase domain-containing protein [Rhabdochlamydiaceae bacterium]